MKKAWNISSPTKVRETMPNTTICPPAPQNVFFQEVQFDPELESGTDPIAFWQGNYPSPSPKFPPLGGQKVKNDRLKKAEAALEGHENKDEIMKILRSGKV